MKFCLPSLFLILLSSDNGVFGFVVVPTTTTTTTKTFHHYQDRFVPFEKTKAASSSSSATELCMAGNPNSEFGFAEIRNGIIGLLIALVVFSGDFLPLITGQMGQKTAPLAESVAVRNAEGKSLSITTVTPTMSEKYRLSRASIQEKLSAIPVFYITNQNGEMDTNIYVSYDDAKEAAGSSNLVKATTLDQVEYPLVLRRGRMRMAPAPVEVSKAEANIDTKYTLIPSKQAIADAAELKIMLAPNDFPLFVADRLAFSKVGAGIQVPLFLEKQDCLTSYERLQKSSGEGKKSTLPEQPIIRATTLNDELFSMEKGSRPGQTQLAFYASAEDVNRAIGLFEFK